jgi:hypothetical protein
MLKKMSKGDNAESTWLADRFAIVVGVLRQIENATQRSTATTSPANAGRVCSCSRKPAG